MIYLDYIKHELEKARMLLQIAFTKTDIGYLSEADAIVRVTHEMLLKLSSNIEKKEESSMTNQVQIGAKCKEIEELAGRV